jgi:hypothetical protein
MLVHVVWFLPYSQRTRLYAGWELVFRLPGPLLIENILMKLRTKSDSNSSAGTEAGICNLLMLQGQAQLA